MADLVVWHVGGGGRDLGPVSCLLPADLTIFGGSVKECRCAKYVDAFVGRPGKRTFHVNKGPLSSSLFPVKACMLGERMNGRKTWATQATLDYEVEVDVHALSEYGSPDVLSLDIQGAEFEALSHADLSNVLCIVTEIEFCEIYEGQGLFHQTHGLLNGLGFRLLRIMNQQTWDGFLTVGEAVYFRHFSLREDQKEKMTFITERFHG